MRIAFNSSLVRFSAALLVAAAAALAAATGAGAQTVAEASAGRLRLESLERLAPKAAEAVDIEIDGFLIKFAGSILSDDDPEEKAVREIVAGLKGIYVKSYEFKGEGQFSEADVGAVREQLRAPLWSRVVDVKSRDMDFGDAEIYVASAAGRVEGLALVFLRPKELTVINIVGAVDLDKLKQLRGRLNIPRIQVKRKK